MAEIRAEKARLETRPLAQHLANRAGEVQYVNQTSWFSMQILMTWLSSVKLLA